MMNLKISFRGMIVIQKMYVWSLDVTKRLIALR